MKSVGSVIRLSDPVLGVFPDLERIGALGEPQSRSGEFEG